MLDIHNQGTTFATKRLRTNDVRTYTVLPRMEKDVQEATDLIFILIFSSNMIRF